MNNQIPKISDLLTLKNACIGIAALFLISITSCTAKEFNEGFGIKSDETNKTTETQTTKEKDTKEQITEIRGPGRGDDNPPPNTVQTTESVHCEFSRPGIGCTPSPSPTPLPTAPSQQTAQPAPAQKSTPQTPQAAERNRPQTPQPQKTF